MSKFCLNCGAEMPDDVKFCPSCGAAAPSIESFEAENVSKDDNFGMGEAPAAPTITKITDAEEIAPEPIPTYDNSDTTGGQYTNANVNYGQPTEAQPSMALAIVSLVCGIVSLLCCCCIPYIGILFSIAAVVCGIISLNKNLGGRGMAIAGIACGGVGLVLIIITIILGAVAGSMGIMEEITEEIMDNLY